VGLASSCEDRTGTYEVSLDHLVNLLATGRRNHLQEPLLLRSFLMVP